MEFQFLFEQKSSFNQLSLICRFEKTPINTNPGILIIFGLSFHTECAMERSFFHTKTVVYSFHKLTFFHNKHHTVSFYIWVFIEIDRHFAFIACVFFYSSAICLYRSVPICMQFYPKASRSYAKFVKMANIFVHKFPNIG